MFRKTPRDCSILFLADPAFIPSSGFVKMLLIYVAIATCFANVLAHPLPPATHLSPVPEENSAPSSPFHLKTQSANAQGLIDTAPSGSESNPNFKVAQGINSPPRSHGNSNHDHEVTPGSSPASPDNSWKSVNDLIGQHLDNGKVNNHASSLGRTSPSPPSSPNRLPTIIENLQISPQPSYDAHQSSDELVKSQPASPLTAQEIERQEQISSLAYQMHKRWGSSSSVAGHPVDSVNGDFKSTPAEDGPTNQREVQPSPGKRLKANLMFWRSRADKKDANSLSRTMNAHTGLSDSAVSKEQFQPMDQSGIIVNDQQGRYSRLGKHLDSAMLLMKAPVPVDDEATHTVNQGAIPIIHMQHSVPIDQRSPVERYGGGKSSVTNSMTLRRSESYPGSYRSIQGIRYNVDRIREAYPAIFAADPVVGTEAPPSFNDKHKGIMPDSAGDRNDLANSAGSSIHSATSVENSRTARDGASTSKAAGEYSNEKSKPGEPWQHVDYSTTDTSAGELERPHNSRKSSGSIRQESDGWSPLVRITGNESPPSVRGVQQDAIASPNNEANFANSQSPLTSSTESSPRALRKASNTGSSRGERGEGYNTGNNRNTRDDASISTYQKVVNKIKSCELFPCSGLRSPAILSDHETDSTNNPNVKPPPPPRKPGPMTNARSWFSGLFKGRRGSKLRSNAVTNSAQSLQVVGVGQNRQDLVNSPDVHSEASQSPPKQRKGWRSCFGGLNCFRNRKRMMPSDSPSKSTQYPRNIDLTSESFGKQRGRISSDSSQSSSTLSSHTQYPRMVDMSSNNFGSPTDVDMERREFPPKQRKQWRSNCGLRSCKFERRQMTMDSDSSDEEYFSPPQSPRTLGIYSSSELGKGPPVRHVHWFDDETKNHPMNRINGAYHETIPSVAECPIPTERGECSTKAKSFKTADHNVDRAKMPNSAISWSKNFGTFTPMNLRGQFLGWS